MKRTGNHKVAVVGWGRGMGHSGHMYLADAVITQAKDMNADPYFFISKTVGKDDPIYPEEKVRIYQRVFPTYANIFSPQGNLNQALTDLSQMGYDGVVVVVGADQKQAFQYLEKPNKEGVPVYQTMGFKKLRVISRQETRSKYAQEEGPRATPMREILMNPTANENAKFKVWRRDMPQALSDEEVLDLMHKAEQRMKAIPTKAKKLKEFITKVRPMLKEANAAQKLKVLKFIKESLVNEFAPGNGDDGLPYAEYVVYQCDPKDQFEFIGRPLYQTDNLGMAHKYAYEHYLRYRPKAFVVYQPHKEASRGNYGVKGESDEEVAEGWKEKVGAAALAGAMATGASANTPKVPLDKAIQQATAVYNINKAVKKHKEKEAEKRKADEKQVKEQGVAEGAPIVVMPRADRLKKPEPTKVRYQGDIVPPTQPPSTEKRGVKGRPGQRPMPDQGVAEGSGKNVIKSVKVGNFRHDLVDTGFGWQVRIYNGDELYDTGMSKNSEQKGLAALDDAVAYTKKQLNIKEQGVAEGSKKSITPEQMIRDAVEAYKKEIAKENPNPYILDSIRTNINDIKREIERKKQGVAEAKSKAIARTAKDLKNPPKVMQYRAKRDQERDKELEYRNIAKRTDEDYLDEK